KTRVIFSMRMEVGAEVSAPDIVHHTAGRALAIGDVSHTLTWGGITRLTDLDTGEGITDWTMTSASGFDYTPAAGSRPRAGPQPPSLVLLGTGLGGCLGLVLLRRRRSQVPRAEAKGD